MKFWIIDELGLRTKDGKVLMRRLDIRQINIPEELLQKIKTDFELWLEAQKRKEDET